MECESDHTVYLRTLAPLNQLYHMLCASPQPWPWFHRQLAFVKRDQRSDKLIWSTRAEYLVADAQAFRRELLAYGAEQLHLGTLVYDSEDTRGRLQRQWHEVVLDIDLTDFTRYCDCGEKKQACGQCWLHIEGTQLLLRYLLCHVLLVEERHLLWVFSGKKGIHCVCNDPRLCVTDANARKRLIALLRRDTTDTLWQLAQELPSDVALQVEQLFERRAITHARALLAVPAFRKHCLTLVRQYCPALYNTLVQSWAGAPDSVRDWAALKALQGNQGQTAVTLLIALTVFYPRIDSGPLEMNHKYKAPFSVHGDTQRVALPMVREALISDTLPAQALTLGDLVRHYRRTGQRCAHFDASVCEFERWLTHYCT